MHPLSIVIPVYNEKATIAKTITAIEQFVKTPHQILVVYDFDEDNTLPVLKNFDITPVKNFSE